jgi:hypothetical protein
MQIKGARCARGGQYEVAGGGGDPPYLVSLAPAYRCTSISKQAIIRVCKHTSPCSDAGPPVELVSVRMACSTVAKEASPAITAI